MQKEWVLRISERRCSIKKAGIKNFAIFIAKHLYWSLFLMQLQTFKSATLLKENPTQVFFCEYWNFLRTEACDFLKKRLQRRCFSMNIAKGCFCLFKRNFVQSNHFNCLILFKDAKTQSFDLLLIIFLHFLYGLISH